MIPAPPTLSQLDPLWRERYRGNAISLGGDYKAAHAAQIECADELAAALPDCRTCVSLRHENYATNLCGHLGALVPHQTDDGHPFGCLAWQPKAHAPRADRDREE